MAISKKLFIAGILILGIQQVTHTHYDAAALKNEVNQILDFAQNLQYQPNDSAYKTAKYLKKLIDSNNYCYIDYDSSATDDDIIGLARIVNSTETFDAKMASILNIKAKKADKKTQQIEADAKQQEEWAKADAKQQEKWAKQQEEMAKANAKQQEKRAKANEKQQNYCHTNMQAEHARNLKIKVRDACILTALITIYGSIIAYKMYTILMCSIQRHKNILRNEISLELHSQIQSMINNTIAANNANKKNNWFNYAM